MVMVVIRMILHLTIPIRHSHACSDCFVRCICYTRSVMMRQCCNAVLLDYMNTPRIHSTSHSQPHLRSARRFWTAGAQ